LKLTIITPDQATVDPNATKGVDDQVSESPEAITNLANTGKSVTTFEYHRDPHFVVKYVYVKGSQIV